jgi:ankyrin repeat protein
MQQVDFVLTLLEFNAEVKIQDSHGQTALHIAADLCNFAMVQMLVEHAAPLDLVDENKNAPLHLAALRMDKKIVELLIRSGANEKLMNAKGLTPMQGVKLTFSKFMRALVAERENAAGPADDVETYKPGNIMNQNDSTLESHADLKDSVCLLCKRRQAIAAMMPCGHLCVCEVCQKERILQQKVCPHCKGEVTGCVNILGD